MAITSSSISRQLRSSVRSRRVAIAHLLRRCLQSMSFHRPVVGGEARQGAAEGPEAAADLHAPAFARLGAEVLRRRPSHLLDRATDAECPERREEALEMRLEHTALAH